MVAFCAFSPKNRPFPHAGAGFSAFCTVLAIFFAKLCAKLPLDKFPKMWYNSIVQGVGKQPTRVAEMDRLG
jgi:hypothetical protein